MASSLLIGNATTAWMLVTAVLVVVPAVAALWAVGRVWRWRRDRRLSGITAVPSSGGGLRFGKGTAVGARIVGFAVLGAATVGVLLSDTDESFRTFVGYAIPTLAAVPVVAMACYGMRTIWCGVREIAGWFGGRRRARVAVAWLGSLVRDHRFQPTLSGVERTLGGRTLRAELTENGTVELSADLHPKVGAALQGVTTRPSSGIGEERLRLTHLRLFGPEQPGVHFTVVDGRLHADIIGGDLSMLRGLLHTVVRVAENLNHGFAELPPALEQRVRGGGADAAEALRLLTERFVTSRHATAAATVALSSARPAMQVAAARHLADRDTLTELADPHGPVGVEALRALVDLGAASDPSVRRLLDQAPGNLEEAYLAQVLRGLSTLSEPDRAEGIGRLAPRVRTRPRIARRCVIALSELRTVVEEDAVAAILAPGMDPGLAEAVLDVLAARGTARSVPAILSFADATVEELSSHAVVTATCIRDRALLAGHRAGELSMVSPESNQGDLSLVNEAGELELVPEEPSCD